MAFKMDLASIKKGAATIKEQAEKKGGFKQFKFKEKVSYIMILQKDSVFIKDVHLHQLWKAGKPVMTIGSPQADGLEDPIMKRGWEIREAFKENPDKELQNLFKLYMPKSITYANVIDLRKIEDGVQVAALPAAVKDLILDVVSEAESEDDLKKIFDLDEARPLKVAHNGGEKIDKKYETPRFLDNKVAGLLKSGKITEEQIEKQFFNLDKLQPVYDDAKIQKYLQMLEEQVKFTLEKKGVDLDGAGAGMDANDLSGDDDFSVSSSSDDDFDLE
jgi:hypothetical protein